MTKSDWSMLIFGVYVFFLGTFFIGAPDVVLRHITFEPFLPAWVQLIGAVFLCISAFNFISVKLKLYWFYVLSSVAKSTAFFWISGLYFLGYIALPITLTGVIDLISGVGPLCACARNGRPYNVPTLRRHIAIHVVRVWSWDHYHQ